MNAHRRDPARKGTLARVGIFVFGAVFVFSLVASAAGFYVPVTLPAAAVSFAAAVGCVALVRLKGGQQ